MKSELVFMKSFLSSQVLSRTVLYVSVFHVSQVGSPQELFLQKREAIDGWSSN